eukprot:jgi/Phyca11/537577/estExt2_fgenesh1_pg.C_PHYCAscaffold_990015
MSKIILKTTKKLRLLKRMKSSTCISLDTFSSDEIEALSRQILKQVIQVEEKKGVRKCELHVQESWGDNFSKKDKDKVKEDDVDMNQIVEERMLMKTASAIGSTFDKETLRGTCPIEAHLNRFSQDLEDLEQLAMIRRIDTFVGGIPTAKMSSMAPGAILTSSQTAPPSSHLKVKFEFNHGFMRGVIREQMLRGQLDKLNARIADFREQQQKELRHKFFSKANESLSRPGAKVHACDPEVATKVNCFQVEVFQWMKKVGVDSEEEVDDWIYMIRYAIESLESQPSCIVEGNNTTTSAMITLAPSIFDMTPPLQAEDDDGRQEEAETQECVEQEVKQEETEEQSTEERAVVELDEQEQKEENSDDEVQFVGSAEGSDCHQEAEKKQEEREVIIVESGPPNSHVTERSKAITDAILAANGYVTSATLEAELQCIICQYAMFKPMSAVCGHSFCRVCLMDSFLTRPIEEAQCPICRVEVLKPVSSKSSLESIFYVNVTLWNLVQLLIPSIAERISTYQDEEEREYKQKLGELESKWTVFTLEERAAIHHGDRDGDEVGSPARWEEDHEGHEDYPVVKVEDTHDGDLHVSRNIVLDTSDENEDGVMNMRVGIAIVEFPSIFELYNEHQECSVNVIKMEEDEESADGMPFFMNEDGDDDGELVVLEEGWSLFQACVSTYLGAYGENQREGHETEEVKEEEEDHGTSQISQPRRRNANQIIDSDDEDETEPVGGDEEQKESEVVSGGPHEESVETELGDEDDEADQPTRKVKRSQWFQDESDEEDRESFHDDHKAIASRPLKRSRGRYRQVRVIDEGLSDEGQEELERAIIVTNTNAQDDDNDDGESDSQFRRVHLYDEEENVDLHDYEDTHQDNEADYPDEDDYQEEEDF